MPPAAPFIGRAMPELEESNGDISGGRQRPPRAHLDALGDVHAAVRVIEPTAAEQGLPLIPGSNHQPIAAIELLLVQMRSLEHLTKLAGEDDVSIEMQSPASLREVLKTAIDHAALVERPAADAAGGALVIIAEDRLQIVNAADLAGLLVAFRCDDNPAIQQPRVELRGLCQKIGVTNAYCDGFYFHGGS
jgi:hypothetical protein